MSVVVMSDAQIAFRAAMARVCTPVSVVTTIEDGRAHGTTVSAFTSLSMTPPMVLVSLDTGSDLLAMVQRSGTFGVNILSTGQAALALRFARKGADKFAGARWTTAGGAARLDGASAWVSCSLTKLLPGGDHKILLGTVLAAEATDLEPLTYHAQTFGTHLRHELNARTG